MTRRSRAPLVVAAQQAGVVDPRVLAAVDATPRAAFVPEEHRRWAEIDRPLAIGDDQTTSQPSLIAVMVAALNLGGHERVLEIGTGHGYQTAILTHLAAQVFSIDRIPALATRARTNLTAAGMVGWHIEIGDGAHGLPIYAPFDAIIVSAATPKVPQALGRQLRDGGRLVAPIGTSDRAEVVVFEAHAKQLRAVRRLMAVRFVPLVSGAHDDGP